MIGSCCFGEIWMVRCWRNGYAFSPFEGVAFSPFEDENIVSQSFKLISLSDEE